MWWPLKQECLWAKIWQVFTFFGPHKAVWKLKRLSYTILTRDFPTHKAQFFDTLNKA